MKCCLTLCILAALAFVTFADIRLSSTNLKKINSITTTDKNINIIEIIVKFIREIIPKEIIEKIQEFIKKLPDKLAESLCDFHYVIFNAEEIKIEQLFQTITNVTSAILNTFVDKLQQIIELIIPIDNDSTIKFIGCHSNQNMKLI